MGTKKIFRSFNFSNNKILNVKVETPTQDGHPVNKKFLEDELKYDTDKAELYINSSKLSWMTGLFGKSLKTILDDLFFPRILPIYNNTVIIPNLYLLNEDIIQDIIGDKPKQILYREKTVSIKFLFDITLNDRPTTNDLGFIEVTYPLGTTQNFYYEGDAADITGSILFTINYVEGIQIKYKKQFGLSPVKLDSYGDEHIDPAYNLIYFMEIDLVPLIKSNCIIIDSPRISAIRMVEEEPTYSVQDAETFSASNEFSVLTDVDAIVDILLPAILYTDYPKYKPTIKTKFYSIDIVNLKETYAFQGEVLLDFDWLLMFTKDMPVMNVFGIDYIRTQMNFGIFSEPIKIVLDLSQVPNTSYLN